MTYTDYMTPNTRIVKNMDVKHLPIYDLDIQGLPGFTNLNQE